MSSCLPRRYALNDVLVRSGQVIDSDRSSCMTYDPADHSEHCGAFRDPLGRLVQKLLAKNAGDLYDVTMTSLRFPDHTRTCDHVENHEYNVIT